jgi:hypothetical protein
MKKVTRTLYRARHYSVNCKRNDDVDIKCGGPPVLGFDFYIDIDMPEDETVEWLKEALKKTNHECMGVSALGTMEVQKLWTQKEILKCMKETRF